MLEAPPCQQLQASSPAELTHHVQQNGQLTMEDKIVVGCALLPKKVLRYLTPRMLETAAANNIVLRQIDYTRPLGPQGPFDVIIHKLRPNPDWEQHLRQYAADNPRVVVVDSLDKIRQLHNRATMLRPLQGDGIVLQQPPPASAGQQQPQQRQVVRVQAPLQVEIGEGTTEAEAQAALTAAGLAPPLLCKPLWTDGRDGSHKLAVLHDLEALGRLLRGQVCSEFKPPLVVQQFVEHGGVLFKVYVLGSQTYVTARPSLGETVLDSAHAVQQLPRISCVSVFSKQQQHMQHMQQPHTGAAGAGATLGYASASPPGSPQSPHDQQQQQQQQPSAALAAVTAESVWRPPNSILAPPAWLTSALAATLREELGMQLFNFDLIVPEQQQQQQQQGGPVAGGSAGNASPGDPAAAAAAAEPAPPLCYVVDVNYFPGVDKLSDFESRFVRFLLSAAASGSDEQQPGHQEEPASAAAAGAAATGAARQQQQEHGVLAAATAGAHNSNDASRHSSSSSSSGGGIGSRRLQHSLSAGNAATTTAAAAASAATGGVHSRRHSGSGGGSGGSSRSRPGSSGGVDVAGLGVASTTAAAATQWGDRAAAVLGSSPPPPQLQVAGCT